MDYILLSGLLTALSMSLLTHTHTHITTHTFIHWWHARRQLIRTSNLMLIHTYSHIDGGVIWGSVCRSRTLWHMDLRSHIEPPLFWSLDDDPVLPHEPQLPPKWGVNAFNSCRFEVERCDLVWTHSTQTYLHNELQCDYKACIWEVFFTLS